MIPIASPLHKNVVLVPLPQLLPPLPAAHGLAQAGLIAQVEDQTGSKDVFGNPKWCGITFAFALGPFCTQVVGRGVGRTGRPDAVQDTTRQATQDCNWGPLRGARHHLSSSSTAKWAGSGARQPRGGMVAWGAIFGPLWPILNVYFSTSRGMARDGNRDKTGSMS